MTDQTCGVVAALDAEIIGEENAGYSAAHLKDIRDRVAELIAADEEYDAAWRSPYPARSIRERRIKAAERRAAALQACKGGA